MDKQTGISLADLERLVKLHNDRHNMLASNIANVDTPGYKAKDIDFKGVLNKEISNLATPHKRHIQIDNKSASMQTEGGTQSQWGDGNNVELDTEVAKITENALMHQFYIRALSGRIKKFKDTLRTK